MSVFNKHLADRKSKTTDEFTPFLAANPAFHPANPVWQGGHKKGLVGLELEVEGDNLPTGDRVFGCYTTGSNRWQSERDGSLRNGMEYVLTGPIIEDEVSPSLEALFTLFASRKVTLRLSDRCSTHVHINCDDLKLNEITSLFILWCIFEDIVLPWCGEDRVGNHFATPISVSTSPVRIMQRALVDGRINPTTREGHYRYAAINLYAFPKFGSLEFRTLRGADNPQMVINWVKYLTTLRKYATGLFSDPTLISNYLSEVGPLGMFRMMCEEDNMDFYNEVLDVYKESTGKPFDDTVFNNFYLVQPLLHHMDWGKFIEKSREPVPPPNPFMTQREERLFNPVPPAPLTRRGARGTGLNNLSSRCVMKGLGGGTGSRLFSMNLPQSIW